MLYVNQCRAAYQLLKDRRLRFNWKIFVNIKVEVNFFLMFNAFSFSFLALENVQSELFEVKAKYEEATAAK